MLTETDAVGSAEVASPRQRVGLVLGPFLFLGMLLLSPPTEMSQAAWSTAAVGVLLAVWWTTEAIPIPVTSLLPLVLLPFLGISSLRTAAEPFADPVIFLFLGGFVLSVAVERWHLHRRVALTILGIVGENPHAIVGGFMAATAMLSMWVSNTATVMMMLPIALSVSSIVAPPGEDGRHSRNFRISLLLGIAYASSAGGLATLIGTPPNALMAGYLGNTFDMEIGFGTWMLFGLPVTIILLPCIWYILSKVVFPFRLSRKMDVQAYVRNELAEIGPLTPAEKRTAVIVLAVALCWMTRGLLNRISGLESLSDAGIAIGGAVAMFLVPAGGKRRTALLSWQRAERIPWGVLLLFGGGLSFSQAVVGSGLDIWLGAWLSTLLSWPELVLTLMLVAMVIFTTELTSNTALIAMLLPILGGLAVAASIEPLSLIVPATIAASCAFMLPVATPPNAVVYASGQVSVPTMVRAGIYLNLLAIPILSAAAYLLIPVLLR